MQQVNLYLPEFRPKRDFFSANYMALLLAILLIVLSLMQAGLRQQRDTLKAQAASLEQDVKTLESKIDRLKNLPKGQDKSKMEEAIRITQAAIHNREYAQQIIQSKNLGNDKGFSPALTALASLSMADVVLTEFDFLEGGKFIGLGGMAKKSAAVPEYLHRLQTHEAFAASQFGSLAIHKSPQAGQILFSSGNWQEKTQSSPNGAGAMLSAVGR